MVFKKHLKKHLFALSFFTLIPTAYANECAINLIEEKSETHRLYTVAGKNINVIVDKGIMYRVESYEENKQEETKKIATIKNSSLCIDNDTENQCITLESESNEAISETFLRVLFCQ